MKRRKTYTDEFKRQAVSLAAEKGNISGVARDLGVDHTLLRRWKQQLTNAVTMPFPGHGNPADPERTALERENTRLREEVEILKKVMGILTHRPR